MAEETQVVSVTHLWAAYFTGPAELHIENADPRWPVLYSVEPTGVPPAADDTGHQLLGREIKPRVVATGKQLYMRYSRAEAGFAQNVVITDETLAP